MKEFEGKKLLILGGMRISCEIIKKAQEMGAFVVVTDYNEPKDSPGKLIADQSFMASTTDVDAVVDLIRQEHIDGVLVGFVDLLLPYYADICERAGLPCYGTKEQFEIFTDKKKYKNLLRQFNIPTIREYDVSDVMDSAHHADIEYPVIVKPTENSGARGITICHNHEELAEAFEKARELSINDEVLVEQYLDGNEATAFWTFQNGKGFVSMIGNRHIKNNQEGVIPLPVGYTFPAAVTDRYLAEDAPKAQKMFEAVGIQNGLVFMQCKVKDGECLVYDIGYRLTGSLEYKILNATCGYDPLEMLIRFALTGHMAEYDIAEKVNPYLGQYAYNISRLSAPGKIDEITGTEDVMKYPGVLDVVIAHPPGETITENMKGLLSQITVRVLGTSNSLAELCRDIQYVQEQIQIISDSGENLTLKGIVDSDLDGELAMISNICNKNQSEGAHT